LTKKTPAFRSFQVEQQAINIPSSIPESKRGLLKYLVVALSQIPGIVAVVLGGSYARGTQRETSDLDLGLYYMEAAPFSLAEIKRLATDISAREAPVVTHFYEWGPWVNGGAWIQTEAGKVDFIYRNLDQVRQIIAEAQQGIIHHDYDQQPAYGFYSVIYLAETDVCSPLHDPHAQIANLKDQVAIYPAKLKQRMIIDWLWQAEFSLIHAVNFAAAGDVYNTVGCLTRIAASLTQALFALNETYFISDKKVIEAIGRFSILPPSFVEQVTDILAQPGQTTAALSHTVARLKIVWQSVVDLAGDIYQPKFRIG
jgi:predicted nucleotidyltransferase